MAAIIEKRKRSKKQVAIFYLRKGLKFLLKFILLNLVLIIFEAVAHLFVLKGFFGGAMPYSLSGGTWPALCREINLGMLIGWLVAAPLSNYLFETK